MVFQPDTGVISGQCDTKTDAHALEYSPAVYNPVCLPLPSSPLGVAAASPAPSASSSSHPLSSRGSCRGSSSGPGATRSANVSFQRCCG